MGEPDRDESISPLSRNPQPELRVSAPTPGAPASTETLRHNDGNIPPNNLDSQLANPEAGDYINGGFPHNVQAPQPIDGRKSNAHLRPTSADEASENVDHATPLDFFQDNGGNSEPTSPGGRRSVQFARQDVNIDPPNTHSRTTSWDDTGRSLSSAFMFKLKQFAGSGNLQIPKSPPSVAGEGVQTAPQSVASSPAVGRGGSRIPGTLTEEDSDADADAEETADEGNATEPSKSKQQQKKKRMMRRHRKPNLSVPNTPIASPPDARAGQRRMGLRRRLSMPDTNEAHHGVSEGEGRDQMMAPSWMRGGSWARSLRDEARESPSPSGRTPRHTRQWSVIGGAGGVSDGDAGTPRRPFFSGERASTFGVKQWKQVKNTLKLLRQKKEDRFDFAKSAELMAELRAGAPAVLMLASMIQRDEHGNKRIPVLLEQVRLRISDSAPEPDDERERHVVFTIDMEYGSGPSRMKWTIIRTVKEVYQLHVRYKFAMRNDKYLYGRADVGARPKQPKFPWAAFPYLRNARNKADSDEDDLASVRGDEPGDATPGERTVDETAEETDNRPLGRRKKSRLGMLGMRRRSTGFTDPGETSALEGHADLMQARRRYVERQRRILEKYLQDMVRWLMFRADSNRLCKFLELSALGVRLAAEGSYHGKECYLHIQSSKGLDFRRVLTPKKVIARHSRKWFLVRSSYIACVDSPENMNIYDVYLVDPKFRIVSKKKTLKQIGSSKGKEIDLTSEPPPDKHHTLTLHTSERRVKLFSRNQVVLKQFEDSIGEMLKQTSWQHVNRFDSFAPQRQGVFAQWLVDGRDYMWNVSRAISMARDVIYIHDWWLSPELYLRRPPAISQKWRLDRLLQRKAREGVKIFIIIYRNVEAAIPIDSEYTKYSLLNLHPNIFVQRSPNQFKKNQFFFAHHEKLCVVDQDIAFVGGIDLCFGRWDCPQHPCVDDKPTGFEHSEQPKDAQHCQLFPGKDYSNARVLDFYKLNDPYEEMYDRGKTPRMAWHDIAMQVVGQPSRDLVRHFVQRWNYIRRGRTTTRPLPFLLPPPDCKPGEMEGLGLTGTCEVQILRSACNWSLGIEEPEHSIQNAYIKMIEDSEHFVYIENQFFITSTEVMNTKIANRIGDALVERIIRAHENDEDWRAVILIPLLPGFQSRVDEQEGTSVRLILQCQFYSICRGENSIFKRLQAAGIVPEDYIQFYSLRQWGKMGSGTLVTEQLYIHAKCIVVDDRVALIGSANINERSLRGDRDSELAALVRDTDMIWSTMGGKPYQVGRFAHTLRLRLMREHLGLDVDEILEEERQAEVDKMAEYEAEMDSIYGEESSEHGGPKGESSASVVAPTSPSRPDIHQARSFNHDAGPAADDEYEDAQGENDAPPNLDDPVHALEVEGYGPDRWKSAAKQGLDAGRDSVIINGREVLIHDIIPEGKGTLEAPKKPHERAHATAASAEPEEGGPSNDQLPPIPPLNRRTTDQLGLPRANQLPDLPVIDDTDIGGPPVHVDSYGHQTDEPYPHVGPDFKPAHIDKDCMRDPLNQSFIDNIWNRAADNNTKIYRRTFRCMPDSEVKTWTEYQEYTNYEKRFMESMEGKSADTSDPRTQQGTEHPVSSGGGGAGVGVPGPGAMAKAAADKLQEKTHTEKAAEHLHHPKTMLPDGMHGDHDEKAALERDSSSRGTAPTVTVDTEKLAAAQANDAASPMYPPGDTPFPSFEATSHVSHDNTQEKGKDRRTTFSPNEKEPARGRSVSGQQAQGSVKRRRRATTRGSRRDPVEQEMLSRAEAEEVLGLVQGHLVQFPYDWLLTEEQNGNWGFQVDGVAPLQIYN
ncbi:phospholipase D1 [Plectosphaerella cucumerina]|uniref:Phospholipase D1 n=1 Tax=Plectosphaerella cucumerina TaxID=40658 RepID=A0A8K0T7N5_9PEZI|nr:phospholipase D1 [Plectosphaerella cucumerina]